MPINIRKVGAGDPLSCTVDEAPTNAPASTETEFEKPRGISKVEIKTGYAQVRVNGLPEPLTETRLDVLEHVRNAQVSIDFLKLTQQGLSFLVSENDAEIVEKALSNQGSHVQIEHERCIVLIHAVNMRDEEGLVARVVSVAIATGIHIDHLGDMHDRIYLVTTSAGATKLKSAIEQDANGGRA